MDTILPPLIEGNVSSIMAKRQDSKGQDLPCSNWQFKFAVPGPYVTKLSEKNERAFLAWVDAFNIPFDPSPTSDYDMRGYYMDFVLLGQDGTEINQCDGTKHYPDTYKTPYHKSFSKESKYAKRTAPAWNREHKLIGKDGTIYWDERQGK